MCAFTMCACAIIIFPAHFASYFHSTFLRSGFHSCPHPLLKIHITGDQRSAIIALSCLPSHQCGPVSGISSHPFQFVWKFQSKCQQKFSIFKFVTKKNGSFMQKPKFTCLLIVVITSTWSGIWDGRKSTLKKLPHILLYTYIHTWTYLIWFPWINSCSKYVDSPYEEKQKFQVQHQQTLPPQQTL